MEDNALGLNPVTPVSKDDVNYRGNPNISDQTFCLVYVMAADKVSLMKDEVIQKMKLIREKASNYNLPQVIIMTKVDDACPLVQDDLRKVYTSKNIKEKMEVCRNLVGVPMNHIFPVKNYHEEMDTNDVMDALILKALDQIVNIAWPLAMLTNPSKKDTLEEKLRNFQLSSPGVKFVRILVIGEIGAGKSSFINSVNSVFQNRITCEALADSTSGTSFTKTYKTHYIKGKSGSHLPFVFNDIMGLEPADGHGAHVADIAKALMGSLKEGHNFNPATPVSKDDVNYRGNPNVSDQTFCLVYVMAADKVSLMKDEVIQKMKLICEKASKYNLPQVIIMTKVDDACPLVQDDLRKVYTSKNIKEKMKECSDRLGVPMNNIFPVKNYHEEVDTDDDLDFLILKALDQIVNIADDALVKKLSEQNTHEQYE
ncbi:interferon-induced protein 44-like isoform X2 [Silurus meridionalis]|nr:interferon-induced protein 44-like isoform X2 [Silurus meridionalis]